jgi:hypothetical protein
MMEARRIDPGSEGEVIEPEPNLYLKHVPNDRRRRGSGKERMVPAGRDRRVGSGGSGGLKMAGWV